jgi:hypothetical protein
MKEVLVGSQALSRNGKPFFNNGSPVDHIPWEVLSRKGGIDV